jgi:HK97 family phage portal protein
MVIARPSARGIPRSLWMKQAQYARLLWGNATLLVGSRDGAGYPKSLEVLPPWEVVFSNTSILSHLSATVCGQPFPVEDLIVVPGQVQPGCTVGVAPLAASGLVNLGKRAQEFGQNWFENGAVPSSIIYSDIKDLTSEQADTIVTTVLGKWKRRRPAVLGSGLKYEKISVPANESQFLETIRQNQAEIAIVLGLSPEDIGVSVSGSAVTYANREQRSQQTLINTTNNDLLLWQEVLYNVVPMPQFVRFNTGALLRSDLKSRYESYKIGLDAGFLTVNEPRGWEDLPSVDAMSAPSNPSAAPKG